ncbi:MAG: hypothetical protein RL326_1513 [Pseudomonadota bacterium]
MFAGKRDKERVVAAVTVHSSGAVGEDSAPAFGKPAARRVGLLRVRPASTPSPNYTGFVRRVSIGCPSSGGSSGWYCLPPCDGTTCCFEV